MAKTASSALAGLSKNVVTNRQTFLRGLGKLPPEFGNRLADNYNDRLNRARGKPLLGEYAPWLLADMLPLNNRRSALRIAPAWMNLYAYTLFVDDVLDTTKPVDHSHSFLASALLLERGISEISAALPRNAKIRVKLDRYFLEAAQAVFKEINQHRQKLDAYCEDDVSRLGEKVALLKLCASFLLAVDGGSHPEKELLIPVAALATGAQLFDDITDWKEDWQSGNYTYLLTYAFRGLTQLGIVKSPEQFTATEVLTAIVLTGSLEDSLNRGLGYLKNVRTSPHLRSHSPAEHLLRKMIQEHSEFVEEVVEVRQYLQRSGLLIQKSGSDWLKSLTKYNPTRKQIGLIDKRLTILANST